MNHEQLKERKEQLDQLFMFGVEWLDKIENNLREQNGKILILQKENQNYKKLHENLAQAMNNFKNGGE